MNLKFIFRRFIDESVLGWLDYYRSTHDERDWAGPLNGQIFRRQMVAAIRERIPFSFVVETGTFRGVTTEYLASEYAVPVFLVESNRRNYGLARARLRRVRNVRLFHGHSVAILRHFLTHEVFPAGTGFFYVDAHSDRHLPLRDEVTLIFEKRPFSIVMIDDFAVPGDPGYGFDDYGLTGALNKDYLADILVRFKLSLFFPSCSSNQETGKRRGAAVLANAILATQLRGLAQLWECR